MSADRFPVEAGHILMFARAVGDPNPIYADAEYAADTEPGRIIAPPTFVQASAQFDDAWFGSGAEPSGVKREGSGGGGLHAEQHFEYHRHIGPGDVLTATVRPGETWEKQSKRGGKLSFAETIVEYRDQNGELVITARGVGVKTEKVVEG
jgi:acyl dehydratase